MYPLSVDPIEKIHYVLEFLQHKAALTPRGGKIAFLNIPTIGTPLGSGDLDDILRKLEQEEDILTMHLYPGKPFGQNPSGKPDSRVATRYCLTLKDKFPGYSENIKKEYEQLPPKQTKGFELNSWIKTPLPELPKLNLNAVSPAPVSSTTSVSIRFDALSRSILLNDDLLIAQPVYDSENYRFFEYVWNNPNRSITLDELNTKLDTPLQKPFSKILDNLNFKGQLREAFFKVSKASIRFTPSRTINELTQAGFYPLRLFTAQKTDENM